MAYLIIYRASSSNFFYIYLTMYVSKIHMGGLPRKLEKDGRKDV